MNRINENLKFDSNIVFIYRLLKTFGKYDNETKLSVFKTHKYIECRQNIDFCFEKLANCKEWEPTLYLI